MATYERQGTAPIEDGDSLDASEIEAEFTAIRTVINGGLTNANLDGSAAITGANIAATTITGAKIAADTITKSKLATAATGQVVLSDSAGAVGLDSSTAYQNCPYTSDITISSLESGKDWVILDYSGGFLLNALGSAATLTFAYDIDGPGNESSDLVKHKMLDNEEREFHVMFAYKATSTSHTFRPRIKSSVASTLIVPTSSTRVIFRAFSIPAK